MATKKQIKANRINAKKSKGPVTTTGKAKVSMNALQHGLYAEHHIAVGEDSAQFKLYVDKMLQSFVVLDAVSGFMVKKIIELSWRLDRFSVIETGILNMEMHDYDRDRNKPYIGKITDKSFGSTVKNHIDKKSELMASAFVKDCVGGERLMKLSTMEGRVLHRLNNLIQQYLRYKKSKGKEF